MRRSEHSDAEPPSSDPKTGALSAGLRYVMDDHPGITRRRNGRGFAYLSPDGTPIASRDAVQRIRALAVPPAWTDVWICPSEHGHLQATGRDARGRKQYRYHPRFREVRESTKYEHMVGFASSLPAIRARVSEDMARRGLSREKVLATVVHLLETTLIRVGNDDYARQNGSYGITTLKDRHVTVDGSEVRFHFVGKSGKQWSLSIRDRRIAKTIRACQDLPGQELLQYIDDAGERRRVSSDDVNTYLRELADRDFTAKDFRTWAGTVRMAAALTALDDFSSEAQAKRNIREAVKTVAAMLGNTPTICRKCYVHPELLDAYLDGSLRGRLASAARRQRSKQAGPALSPVEAAVLRVLRSRPKKAGARRPLARPATSAVRASHPTA